MTPLPDVPAWIDVVLASVPGNDHNAQQRAVYRHLAGRLQPGSFLEEIKVQEMVLAWLEIARLRRHIGGLNANLRRNAAEHYELNTRRQMERLSRDLRKSPFANEAALRGHYIGIDFLIERWERVVHKVEHDLYLDLQHIFDLMNAMGSSEHVNECSNRAEFFMLCYLGFQKENDRDTQTWIYRSRMHPTDTRIAYERHIRIVLSMPSPEIAKERFVTLVREGLELLREIKEKLKAGHECRRAEFAESNPTDRTLLSSIRTHQGFMRLQFSRLVKLEKEFQTLLRERAREDERKQLFEARLEAVLNGVTPARKRRSSDVQADEWVEPQDASLIPGPPEPFSVAPNPDYIPENEIEPDEMESPANTFPEMELISEVVASAGKYNQDLQTEDPSAEPAEEEPAEAEGTLAEARKIVASLNEKELKHPFQHAEFKRIYQKARGLDRKQIMKRVEEEKTRRNLLLNFQPSG